MLREKNFYLQTYQLAIERHKLSTCIEFKVNKFLGNDSEELESFEIGFRGVSNID